MADTDVSTDARPPETLDQMEARSDIDPAIITDAINRKIRKTICAKKGHGYYPLEDTDWRHEVPGDHEGQIDTVVHRSFMCGACGETISPVVAVWKNFKVSKAYRK